MRLHITLYIAALLVLFGERANAQRCLPKMKAIEIRGGMVDGIYSSDKGSKAGYCFGATLSSYAKGGDKWAFGAEYLQTHKPYNGERLPVAQMTAEGGYAYNFLSDRSKTLFFYLGGLALAGYESVNWGDKQLKDGATIHNEDAIIYGCAVSLEMEVYLSDGFALTAFGRERFMWGGSTDRCHTQFGIGLKFVID